MPLSRLGLIAAAITFAVLPYGAIAQSLEEATAALKAGDFATAETILNRLSQDDDPAAMRELARLHLSGRAATPDAVRARDLLKQAVNSGNAAAGLDLGYVLLEGIGGPADPLAARGAFAAAADANDENVEARFMWGKTSLMVSKDPEDLRNAMAEIQLASTQKYGPALALSGDFYLSGTFVGRDPKRAMSLYQEAYANGHKQSAVTVADLFAFGELGTVDLDAAGKWYARAASDGSTKAAHAAAMLIYADPQSSDADLQQAFSFATSAALAWNEDAQYLLGRMYLEGRAVGPDLFEAFKWLDLAATSAVLDAHYLRAIVARDLGPDQVALAREVARTWFETNHATPHSHRLLVGKDHVFQ